MSENVDSIILEQLKQLREAIGVIDAKADRLAVDVKRIEDRLWDKIDEVEEKVDGQSGLLTALGKYSRDIDERVEHIEEKLGIET
jgi:DNA repair exonuclease SbcCD ATPase subunit